MRVFLFYVAIGGFTLGIFWRSFFHIGLPVIVWLLVMSLVVGFVWRRNSSAVSSPHLLTVSLFLLLFALGIFRMEIDSWSEINPVFESALNNEISYTGLIVQEPDVRESTTHLMIKVNNEKLLVYANRFVDYKYGDRVTVTGTLAKPESFATDLGRNFNYPDYLHAKGVNYIVKFANVTVLDSGQGNFILTTLLDAKHAFMNTIETLIPEPQVGLGEGLLLGVKRALGNELNTVFRQTGIIHIVVLSGYNIMLVVIFVTFILDALIPKRFQLPFGIVAISFFALIVGLSATVMRASIMAILYLIATATNRTYMVLRALMLAGVFMILINPYLLAFDVGFQLSFMATLGLLLLAPHIEKGLFFVPKFWQLRDFLTATIATQIFVSPILLYQIGQFSLVAPIVNVLVLPMVSTAMLLTLITGLVGFLSTPLAMPLATLTYLSLNYIILIPSWFATLPFASFRAPVFPFWIVPLSYGVLGYIIWRLHFFSSQTVKTPTENKSKVIEDEVELAGWVIEEETVVEKRNATSRKDVAITKADETPIFFR